MVCGTMQAEREGGGGGGGGGAAGEEKKAEVLFDGQEETTSLMIASICLRQAWSMQGEVVLTCKDYRLEHS